MADIETILCEMRSGQHRVALYGALDRLVQGKTRAVIDAREDTTVADLMLRVAEDIACEQSWGSNAEIANGRND